MSLSKSVFRDVQTLLIRHLRGDSSETEIITSTGAGDDRRYLLLLWALSPSVGAALTLIGDRGRTLVEAHQPAIQLGSSGVILARESAIAQATTGNPAMFVSQAMLPTVAGGANQVLAWFVSSVQNALKPFPGVLSGTWEDTAQERLQQIERARALPGIKECFDAGLHLASPDKAALRAAATLRNPLYSRALVEVQRRVRLSTSHVTADGDSVSTALASLETWRQFELLAALLAKDALAKALASSGRQGKVQCLPILGGGEVVAQVGPLSLRCKRPANPS